MKIFGGFLAVVGAIWALLAFLMDTTIQTDAQMLGSGAYSSYLPSARVHNIGLIERRRTHLTLSGFTVIAGVVLFGFGSIKREVSSGSTRACPKCAESILSAASKCRYCGSDVEPMGQAIVVARGDAFELERLLEMIENEYVSLDVYIDAVRAAGGKLEVCGSVFRPYYLVSLNGNEQRIEKFEELKPWCLEQLRPLVALTEESLGGSNAKA